MPFSRALLTTQGARFLSRRPSLGFWQRGGLLFILRRRHTRSAFATSASTPRASSDDGFSLQRAARSGRQQRRLTQDLNWQLMGPKRKLFLYTGRLVRS